jgi:hypothetical protein
MADVPGRTFRLLAGMLAGTRLVQILPGLVAFPLEVRYNAIHIELAIVGYGVEGRQPARRIHRASYWPGYT